MPCINVRGRERFQSATSVQTKKKAPLDFFGGRDYAIGRADFENDRPSIITASSR